MSIQSALDAIALVGKTVRPVKGSVRWTNAHGKPRSGVVINVRIIDLDHPYVVVKYGSGDIDHPYPFELEVVAPELISPAQKRAIKTGYSRRFTGWQEVYGLRRDIYPCGYASQYDLGCLDATTSLPGGPLRVETTSSNRWAFENTVLREGI